MKRSKLVLGIVLLSVVTVAPTANARHQWATATTARSCGVVGGDNGPDTGWAVRITVVHGVTCRKARAVVRQCGPHHKVPGWTVRLRGASLRMTNGSTSITVKGIAGGSPRCLNSAYGF